jgi:hypothetical protein
MAMPRLLVLVLFSFLLGCSTGLLQQPASTLPPSSASSLTSSVAVAVAVGGSPRWRRVKGARRMLRERLHFRRAWRPTALSWGATAATLGLQRALTDSALLQRDAAAFWTYFADAQLGAGEEGLTPLLQQLGLYLFMWVNIVGFLLAMPVLYAPQMPKIGREEESEGETQGDGMQGAAAATAPGGGGVRSATSTTTSTTTSGDGGRSRWSPLEVPKASRVAPHALTGVDYSFIALNTLCLPGFFYHFLLLLRTWGLDLAAAASFSSSLSMAPPPAAYAVDAAASTAAASTAASSAALRFDAPSSVNHHFAEAVPQLPSSLPMPPLDQLLLRAEGGSAHAAAGLQHFAFEALPSFAGALALYFFAYELAYYQWHRALHEVPALYK